ncbi:MAG: hypothetical protein EF807_08215, partial [Candidatus Methanolliviera hydrocarbonicum]
EWMEAYWGASKAGFVPVNINPRFVAEEIRYVLEDSDSVVLFMEDRWIDPIEEIRRDLPLLKDIIVYNAPGYSPRKHPSDPIYEDYEDFMQKNSGSKPKLGWEVRNDDLCFLMYTGGTTGWPKGVVYDNWNRAGSMRWGMFAQMMESGMPLLAGYLLKNPDFAAGMANLVENAKIPLLSPLIARTMNAIAGITSKNEGLRNILSAVLTSDQSRRLVFQYLFPYIFGQPISYALFGGHWKHVAPLPLMHGAGYESCFCWLCLAGITQIFPVPGQPFDAKEYWESVEKNRATMSTVVGDAFVIPMLEELDRATEEGRPYDLRSLTIWVSSGVRWSAHLKEKTLKYMPNAFIADAYGTTESGLANMSPVTSGMKAEEIPEHTTDVTVKLHGPHTGNHLVLDLDTGEPAKPGCKHAQFAFAGPMGLGYWKAPSKTKKDFVTIHGERYFLVGDEGYVDDKGGFHLQGRGGSYVINTGGEKVYSEEVEEKLRAYPKVRDAVVVGIPDERWGEAVTAIVELEGREKATEDEMREYCKGEMAGFKVPKHFIFHDVVRAGAGKVMRPENIEIVLKELKKK